MDEGIYRIEYHLKQMAKEIQIKNLIKLHKEGYISDIDYDVIIEDYVSEILDKI